MEPGTLLLQYAIEQRATFNQVARALFLVTRNVLQARNQDFMWGCANEAKVDQTTEMYFLLPDPFIQESSDTWKIVTTKYAVGTEY